jgi:hypothetical protein
MFYPDGTPISSLDNIDYIWVSGYDMERSKLPSWYVKVIKRSNMG